MYNFVLMNYKWYQGHPISISTRISMRYESEIKGQTTRTCVNVVFLQ